ncbi:hypothetical protein CP533_3872 [Ophiocordyceps camponoti-saundersi (nom. inval.)]|nr:hypothetical protein CP533_3872 [Ophiocordyceps camponoti-saundersi (nom. inval.)]
MTWAQARRLRLVLIPPPSERRRRNGGLTLLRIPHWDHVDGYYREKLQLLGVGGDGGAGSVGGGGGAAAGAAGGGGGGGSYFDVDDIANLPVKVDVVPDETNPTSSSEKPEAKKAKTRLLRDLAHVVPKGKTAFVLLVHDEQHVEPVQLAVQNSHFNQTPTRSEEDVRQLTVRFEPERLDAPLIRVKALYQRWIQDVRVVRAKQEKLIKAMHRQGDILEDNFRKAKNLLQKLQEKKISGLVHEEKVWSLTAKFNLELKSS